jgi:DNA-binding NarL/FixJ family response regulator
MTENIARILLVDDHELFREGLAGLINAQPDMAVVGQAGDGLEALTLARDLQPDLIVMDINMPICDGLEATRLIRADLPETRIIILTVHDEDEKLFEAIKAGANGYMLKDTNSAEFLQGVRGGSARGSVAAAQIGHQSARRVFSPGPTNRLLRLPRQKRPISPRAN